MNVYLSAACLLLILSYVKSQYVADDNSVREKFSSKPFNGVSVHDNVGEAYVTSGDAGAQKKAEDGEEVVPVRPTWSTLLSALFKFFTGKSDRDGSGTRQLVSFVISLLDMFKQYFVQRSAQSREAIGIGRVSSDAASAVITMVKGYIKSMATRDEGCMQRYLCEINREVVRDSREIGYIIGKAGSSMISYFLERSRMAPYDANYNASRLGLDGDDCESLSFGCNEIY